MSEVPLYTNVVTFSLGSGEATPNLDPEFKIT